MSPDPDQPEREPVEDLHQGDDAEPHEEAEEAADLRYEVEQGHPDLKLFQVGQNSQQFCEGQNGISQPLW